MTSEASAKGDHLFSLKRFTLVELLVVISIIIVLAGMLLPALGQVRARSKSVTCMSNLKSCAYALNSYANTYTDHFPAALSKDRNDSGTEKTYGWCGVLIRKGFLAQEVTYTGGQYVRLTQNSVIKCPSVIYSGDTGESYYHDWHTYGLIQGKAGEGTNEEALGSLGNYGSSRMFHVKRAMLTKSRYCQIPLGGDSIHADDGLQPAYLEMLLPSNTNRYVAAGARQRAIHVRHLGKGNIFYADGHVVSVTGKEIVPDTWLKYADKVAGPVSY